MPVSFSPMACLILAALISTAFSHNLVKAAEIRCAEGAVVVIASGEDGASACKGANQAIIFLKQVGLKTTAAVRIELSNLSNSDIPTDAYGCYDAAGDIIRMLDYESCKQLSQDKSPFGQKMSRQIYESFIAHEVAHAVATANFVIRNPSRLAQEYIAYVTQFAVMPAPLRDKMLQRYHHVSIDHVRELSYASWLMTPDIFAVLCYKHFLKAGNGGKFIVGLLSGMPRLYVPELPF